MKKIILLLPAFFCIQLVSQSQDFGYKTFDIGGDFQWHPDGSTLSLHLAYYAKIHHSITARFGYNNAQIRNTAIDNMRKGQDLVVRLSTGII